MCPMTQIRRAGKAKRARRIQLENHPRFLRRVENARKSLRAGRGVRLENVKS
jgi:hypothetical protein